jgi:hypothetical protein
MRRLRILVVVGVATIAIAACSSGGSSVEPLTNDEAVDALVQQGYTAQSAQCLIDGAAKQNVDVLEFLVSGEMKPNTQAVLDAVGSYCVQQFGGTSIPGTSVP